jgi:20S proteasome alpha/beta subunit
MTLCIAAFSNQWIEGEPKRAIYCCSDARIETSTSGSETEYKFKKVGARWAAMLAGNVGRAEELLNLYSDHIESDLFGKLDVTDSLRVPPQKMKTRIAAEYVANMTGMSWDDFVSKGQAILPVGLYESVCNDVARIEIGCQLILIPVVARNCFYIADSDGSISIRKHFAAIGSGSSNAEAWLHFREQEKFTKPASTIIHLLEAKRFAENAPGVGKKTHLALIDNESRFHQFMNVEATERQVWRKYGPKSTAQPIVTVDDSGGEPTPWDELAIG